MGVFDVVIEVRGLVLVEIIIVGIIGISFYRKCKFRVDIFGVVFICFFLSNY